MLYSELTVGIFCSWASVGKVLPTANIVQPSHGEASSLDSLQAPGVGGGDSCVIRFSRNFTRMKELLGGRHNVVLVPGLGIYVRGLVSVKKKLFKSTESPADIGVMEAVSCRPGLG